MTPKLILASGSPRRRSLMRQAGYRFRVIPSHVKETVPPGLSSSQTVMALAVKKAKNVAKKYPHHRILGADTLVYLKSRKIGKPRNKKHARWILRQLSGKWQKVYTGVAVATKGGKRLKKGYAVSFVKLRPLTLRDINTAIQKHMDKAGAYAVQQKKDPFVEKIIGDYDNVVGLPMRVVRKLLRATF